MGLLGPLVRHFIRVGNKFLLLPKVERHDFQVCHLFCNEQTERLIFLKYPKGAQCCLSC